MTNIETSSSQTLFEALEKAVQTEDLDQACATVQAVLGVSDGSHAEVTFRALNPKSDDLHQTWADLTPKERYDQMLPYVLSEIGGHRLPSLGTPITVEGFGEWCTNGNKMALGSFMKDKSYWLVTNLAGDDVPNIGEAVSIGHYDKDGKALFIHDYAAGQFKEPEFLAMVARGGPDYRIRIYDRDAMIDARERQEFLEEQESEEEQAFAAFQDTRVQMSVREYMTLTGDNSIEREPEEQLFVYADRYYIEHCTEDRYQLVLANQCWITGPDTTLEMLERELFEYSLHD